MCDCFMPKCHLCETRLPLHISDFCTPRENVEVYCPQHVGKTHQFPGSVWEWECSEADFGMRKGSRMGILILDTEGLTGEYLDSICPNSCGGEMVKKHPRRDGGCIVETARGKN